MKDEWLCKIRDELELGKALGFVVSDNGVLRFSSKSCVSEVDDLKKDIMTEKHQTNIMTEKHQTAYIIHPSSNKMYKDLRECYWWSGMKKDIVEFVSRCLTCERVKGEHQKSSWFFQLLLIPEWK